MTNKIIIWLVLTFFSAASLAVTVSFSGRFLHPGVHEVQKNRLLNALATAIPTDNAYFIGGALFRQAELGRQQAQKVGLIYDINMALSSAYVSAIPELKQSLLTLISVIERLPITGRIKAELDPLVLKNKATKNLVLQAGDTIYLPSRPGGLFILGAVRQPGFFKFKDNSVLNVSKKITRAHYAQNNWVWVIQPDGHVEKVGVGRWNYQQGKLAAPGAILFFPYSDIIRKSIVTDINHETVKWLATQTMSPLLIP